jgi:hypothetical protein
MALEQVFALAVIVHPAMNHVVIANDVHAVANEVTHP